jgi:small subunit ribosomal protein S20
MFTQAENKPLTDLLRHFFPLFCNLTSLISDVLIIRNIIIIFSSYFLWRLYKSVPWNFYHQGEKFMQRHKSVEKRARTNKKANLANRMGRSRIKTAVKEVTESKDKKIAEEALKTAMSVLDKGVKSGLIHKNKAANKKSKLAKAISKLEK